MSDILSFDLDAITLHPAQSLPSDRLSLCVIDPSSGRPAPRLVLMRAKDGVPVTADGSELSNAWSLRGWFEAEEGIALDTPAATQAQPRALDWRHDANGDAHAPDGLGGLYIFHAKRSRLEFEASGEFRWRAEEKSFSRIAQNHFDARIRASLEAQSPDQKEGSDA